MNDTSTTTIDLADRVARLRDALQSTTRGRAAVRLLAPPRVLSSAVDVVDFCDWSQFNQWPQMQ